MLYKVARAISDEVRAKVTIIAILVWNSQLMALMLSQNNNYTSNGIYNMHTGLSCWSPVLNLLRDPRWGRNQVHTED